MARRTVETRFTATDELSPALARMARGAQATAVQVDALSKTTTQVGSGTTAAAGRLDGLTKRLDASAGAAEKASAKYKSVGDAGKVLATTAVLAGAGVAGMVTKYAAFDKAMSGVSAATMASASDLNRLRDAAIKLGGDTQYSAKEAAQGITEMAKAGVSTADILDGGLAGALSLAAAGQMEVADAAGTASAAMVQFKLKGNDLGHVADLLAAGAGKALGSVHDLGMALNQTGLVAASTGLSIEESVGGLAAFASAGLVGSDAGTSFKTMLQRLSPQTKEAAAEVEKLGLNAYDSQGNFIGLAEYAGKLQSSMSGLNAEQRQASMQTIFGADAVRAATVLYENGADGIRKWTSAVNDQGYAARQASLLTDNLAGDWERLTGAFDSVVIKSGSGVNDALRGMAQGAENVVEAVGKIPAPVLQTAAGLTALGVAAAGGLGAIGMAVPKIMAGKAAIDQLGLSAGRTGAALSALGKGALLVGVAAAASAMHEWVGASSVATQKTDQLADSLKAVGSGAGDTSAFLDLFSTKGLVVSSTVASASDALRMFGENAAFATRDTNAFGAVIDVAFRGKSEAVGVFNERVKQIDASLAALHSSGNAEAAKAAMDQLMQAVADQGGNVEAVRGQFELYNQALALNTGAQAQAKEAAIASSAAAQGMTTEEYKLKTSLEEVQKAAESFRSAVEALGASLLGQRDSMRGFEAAIDAADAAVKENGKTLDIHTEKGRNNQAALDAVASAGTKAARAILENGGSIEQAAVQVDKTRAAFIAAATKMGMSQTAASRLATQLGLTKDDVVKLAGAMNQLPKTLSTTVNVVGLKQAQVNLAALATKLKGMDNRVYEAKFVTTYMNRGLAPAGAVRAAARATGGAVFGPGTATSDSIPALLSNNEHVWTAAEVDAYGGHEAMLRLRRAVLSGRVPRFATGGRVARASGGSVSAAQVMPGVTIPVTYDVSVQLLSLLSGLDLTPQLEGTAAKAIEGVDKLRSVLTDFVEKYGEATQKMAAQAAKGGSAAATARTASSAVGVAYNMSGALGQAPASLRNLFVAYGAKYGVAPELLAAVAKQESGFNSRAVSPAGARGLMQFMPGTARQYGVNTSSAASSIDGAARLLRDLLQQFKGQTNLALAGYSAGPGNVANGRWRGFSETRNYVAKIMADPGVSGAARGVAAGAASSASSDLALQMITNAKQVIGNLYRYGGGHGSNNNKVALKSALVDCSGLLNVSLSKALGKNVSEVSDSFLRGKNAKKLSVDQALKTAGAFVGRTGSGKSGHIAISLGDGTILESPSTGKPVRIRKTTASEWNAAAWDIRLGQPGAATAVADSASEAVDYIAAVRDEMAKSLADLGVTLSAAELAKLTPDRVLGLAKLLDASKPVLTGLATAYDVAAEAAKQASEDFDKLKQEHAQFVDSLTAKNVSTGSLATLFKVDADGIATSVQAIIDQRRKAVENIEAFEKEIEALKSAGLNEADLQDFVGMGAETGLQFAKGLKDAGPGAIFELNNLQTSLKVASAHMAMVSGDALYAAGESSAERLLKGMLANEGAAKTQLINYGQRLVGYIQSGMGGGVIPTSVPAPGAAKTSVTVQAAPVTTVVQLDGKEIARYTSSTVVQAFNRKVATAGTRVAV